MLNYVLRAILLFSTLLAACAKEDALTLSVRKISLPHTANLMSVCFRDSMHGVVTGGTLWKEGVIFSTADGGQQWTMDTLVRNRLECVMFNAEGNGFCCGVDGLGLRTASEWGKWDLFRNDWFWAKSCDFPSDQYGIMLGGEGWKQGQSRSYGPDAFWQQDTQSIFPAEMTDVCFVNPLSVVAVGMGWVMRSEDAGRHWQRLPIEGDFFKSVHFPDKKTGYICGYQGSIYKSEDGGMEWKKIRDGGPSAAKDKAFSALYFKDPAKGWIVGERGLVWRTQDGGQHWSELQGIPEDVDCTSVFADAGGAWVTGFNGHLFYIKE